MLFRTTAARLGLSPTAPETGAGAGTPVISSLSEGSLSEK